MAKSESRNMAEGKAAGVSNPDSGTKALGDVENATPASEPRPITGWRLGAGTANGNENEDDNKPFVDKVYDRIEEVLGGDNAEQFLCLTLPGQSLSAKDFSYDYQNSTAKGTVVEANESRLANKMFDPCRVTGADNGLTLPYQYRSALDMLTPKLNAKIARAKNQLRELLMTEYPYDFGEDGDKTYTLQEVFFRLYDEWVEESEKWAKEQSEQKALLRQRYADNAEYNDKYLEWYEDNAESRLETINEKMSKVISVFTPNDMKILEGVLDSGSGAELQQARETLLNTQKRTPDGGCIYPVKFNPTNWFELLDTSFKETDLLDDPAVLSEQLEPLLARRKYLAGRISSISALVPDKGDIEAAKSAMEKADETMEGQRQKLIDSYGNGAAVAYDVAVNMSELFSGDAAPRDVIRKLAGISDGEKLKDLINNVINAAKGSSEAQAEYVSSLENLADKMAASKTLDAYADLKNSVNAYNEELEELDAKIKTLQDKIKLSSVLRPKSGEDGTVTDAPDLDAASIGWPPDGYTQVVITSAASAVENASSRATSTSVSSSGGGFLFFGHHKKKVSTSSSFKDFARKKDAKIQIGMNVAKVGIEREWFNPGVFALTKDMFNVTSLKVAPDVSGAAELDDRLKAMQGSVFPCYPVAMVIARDVTMKLSASESINSDFADEVEQHSASGGGFLFFSGGKGSNSSSSDTGVHSSFTDKTVTLKFSTPQIIGYYLEITAPDRSTALDDITAGDERAGYVSISKFVEDYRKMLEAVKEKKEK